MSERVMGSAEVALQVVREEWEECVVYDREHGTSHAVYAWMSLQQYEQMVARREELGR